MVVAQGTITHICEFNGALATGVHEPVAALRMKFGSGDNFGQFLHIGWLYIDDIEALILNVQIPKIYPQVVARYESLTIRVNRNRVDMVGMGISVCPTRDSCDNGVVVGETW